jgi:hypothetical protein
MHLGGAGFWPVLYLKKPIFSDEKLGFFLFLVALAAVALLIGK